MVARLKDYYLGLYEKSMPNTLDLREKLRQAKDAGFDFMEISIDETDEKLSRLEMSKEERKDLVDAMYQVGLPIKTIASAATANILWAARIERSGPEAWEIMERPLSLPVIWGCGSSSWRDMTSITKRAARIPRPCFLENLKNPAEMAAAAGVTLAFETMETEFMNTVEKAMKYVKLVDSPLFEGLSGSGEPDERGGQLPYQGGLTIWKPEGAPFPRFT